MQALFSVRALQAVRALACGGCTRLLNFHHLAHLKHAHPLLLQLHSSAIIKLLVAVVVALWGVNVSSTQTPSEPPTLFKCVCVTACVRNCMRWVWQLLLMHFVGVFGHSPVYAVLCARVWTCLHAKQGIALSFIIVITGIMTSVGDKRYSTAWWKPETVTAVSGTDSQGGNCGEEEWPSSLPHQYSSEWMYSSIRCLFLHCSVVWQRCKQQQHNLNRCNTACPLAGMTNSFITPKCMHAL